MNIHQKYREYGVKTIGVDVWDGSISQLNAIFIQPTSSTYDFIPQASAISMLYGLGVHSFVVVGLDKEIKYVSRNYDEESLSATLDVLTSTPGEKPKVFPLNFYLSQNYPNPFNPTTRIEFEVKISQSAHAELIVYDMSGRRIKTLLSQTVTSGFYAAEWDGANELGEPMASGVYVYVLNLPDIQESKRMLLLR